MNSESRLEIDVSWKPEINCELVLSIEHITPQCSRWLQKTYDRDTGGSDDMRSYITQILDDGYRIWIPTERDYVLNLLEICENNGYRELVKALMVAISYKCKYLLISADGDVCPFLEAFTW